MVIVSLRVLGSLLARDHEVTDAIIDSDITPSLLLALSHANPRVRKEAAWVASNISAGGGRNVSLVAGCGIVERAVELVRVDTFEVRKECVWVLSNAVNSAGDWSVVKRLVEVKVAEVLCEMLHCKEPQTLIIAMEGLDGLLKYGKEHPIDLVRQDLKL